MKPTFLSRFFHALNQLSNAEIAQKTGLRDWAQKLLYHGTKTGVKAGNVARQVRKDVKSRFEGLRELLPGEGLQPMPKAGKHPFDLSLTEEQEMTREMLQRFAIEALRPQAREVEQDVAKLLPLLEEVQGLGLTLVAIPEALDGAGTHRTPTNHTLVGETLAYGDMGLALAALAPLGFVNALTAFGTEAQQARYLPGLAGESFVPAAVAVMEPHACFSPESPKTRAVRSGGGFRLNGTKSLVPLCEEAEVYVITATLDGAGPKAFLVEAGAAGLFAETTRYMGCNNAAMGQLTLENVEVSADALLGGEGMSYDHGQLLALGRIGICALAVGTCQAVIDYAANYCNERIAFGEPISHRQAVAFQLADMAIELEGMRLLTYRAASRAEQGKDFTREAYLAHIQCAKKAMEIGSHGVQLLGGHGYICEHPVERWYRQLRAIAVLEGVFLV